MQSTPTPDRFRPMEKPTPVTVYPARAGLLVGFPGRPYKRHLDAAGELVELSTYWRRRINRGDVTTEPAPPASSSTGSRKSKGRTKPETTRSAED